MIPQKRNEKRIFECKDSSEIRTNGYDNALLLVTQAIDTIMTGEGLDDKDLVISKLGKISKNTRAYFPMYLQLFNQKSILWQATPFNISIQIQGIATPFVE